MAAHRWSKPVKNKRRIDPRYFLEETATRGEEPPEDIQRQLDENEKMGIPSEAVYDQKTRKWRVEENN